MLQSMELQRVGHDLVNEQEQQILYVGIKNEVLQLVTTWMDL